MAIDVEEVLLPLAPGLQQSSEQDVRCALLRWPLTTTATWSARIERISILSKSLLFSKIHLIMYLFQGKAASFYCYCIQPKTSELQDKYFHGQNPSNMPCDPRRDSNRNLLFASLWNESFLPATVFTVVRPSLWFYHYHRILQSISRKISTFNPRAS